MKVFVAGNTHLSHYTKIGAAFRGLNVTNEHSEADLILIAQDTLTDDDGVRDLTLITSMVKSWCDIGKPVILMSQVPPGFCRKQNRKNLYHYPETLRIKDSYERACNPEYIVIGTEWPDPDWTTVNEYVWKYVKSMGCAFIFADYESAEMCKIAVNTILASQVDCTNRLAEASKKVGAKWELVRSSIENDKRIGKKAYLTPGRWQDSLHLLRDSVTLKEIECTPKPI